jgi:histone acetyltransferase (RNA polymerase elongator complex component)
MTAVDHADHGPWEKHGPCVYCPCGARLYQGTLPTDQHQMAASLDALADAIHRIQDQGDPTR